MLLNQYRRSYGYINFTYEDYINLGNRNVPKYQKDTLRYWKVLKSLNIPSMTRLSREQALDQLDIIVGSPDGIHFINLYLYTFERLREIFERQGLNIRTIKQAPIPGLTGAETIFYYIEPRDDVSGVA